MAHNCGCDNRLNAVDKIRKKGYASLPLPNTFEIQCECGNTFEMINHEAKCSQCHMVYGVTPCSSDSVDNVVAVGINY